MSEPEQVHVETISPPTEYAQRQIDQMCLIAAVLDRGTLVVFEPPEEEA